MIGIERLHHEIIGARVHRASYLRNIIFIQANDDFRTIATLRSAKLPKEFVTIKRRHVDVDENSVRHGNRASRQRFGVCLKLRKPERPRLPEYDARFF